MRDVVIFIVGPTSSGKTQVATKLAEEINGEIFSCDSMQVYKDMDILTQAPSEELTSRIKHHLVRIIPPEEEFNVAEFTKKTQEAINDILLSNKVPIGVGGTGLYIKSLLDGIFTSPPKDANLRERLKETALAKGNEYLYHQLKKVDPRTAAKLHPNDLRRVIRALEEYELTGTTIHDKKTK